MQAAGGGSGGGGEVTLTGVRGNMHNATLSSFKAKLRTFLFSQYFHPN